MVYCANVPMRPPVLAAAASGSVGVGVTVGLLIVAFALAVTITVVVTPAPTSAPTSAPTPAPTAVPIGSCCLLCDNYYCLQPVASQEECDAAAVTFNMTQPCESWVFSTETCSERTDCLGNPYESTGGCCNSLLGPDGCFGVDSPFNCFFDNVTGLIDEGYTCCLNGTCVSDAMLC